jgi:hypothetical protein
LDSDPIKAKESPYAIVVTEIFSTDHDKDTSRPKSETDLPPTVTASLSTQIEIKSQGVIHALRCIIGYYPEFPLTGETVRIEEPFLPLYFYRQELQDYRDQFADTSNQREACSEDANVAGDIQLLLDIFDKKYGQRVQDELRRHNQEKPTCTHDMAWMLFKPGTDFYVVSAETAVYDPAVLGDVCFEYTNGNPGIYSLSLWDLCTDAYIVSPGVPFRVEMVAFVGEKEIADLTAFPCKYMRMNKHGATHEQRYHELVERGRMYLSMSKNSRLLSFDGHSAGSGRPAYRGRVMVDMRLYCRDVTKFSLSVAVERSSTVTARCDCPHCVAVSLAWSERRTHFTNYMAIPLARTSELEEHQYFLCERHFPAFILKHRIWGKYRSHLLRIVLVVY